MRIQQHSGPSSRVPSVDPKDPSQTDGCYGLVCGSTVNERIRYFPGKYLTARDFTDEQAHLLSRHRLHNRLLHGWGIVCGLRVERHPNPNCPTWVVVRAGIAIDCCGREIILPEDRVLELPLPWNEDGSPRDNPDVMNDDFLVCLRYTEKAIEKGPVLYGEGACDPNHLEANRVREVPHLVFCAMNEVDPDCWPLPNGDPETRCRDDCDHPLPGPAGTCLEPVCPCHYMVPLALIDFDPAQPKKGFVIDTTGRRSLSVPPESLTHIASINWPHGGELSLAELQDMNGRLEVTFDRKLKLADGERTGVNRHSFRVQYVGAQRSLELLRHEDEHQPKLESNCLAVYTIAKDLLSRLAGHDVYVTLYCDLIMDCHENPVDGDHLAGVLPSGNGTPGGEFYSWFHVIEDDPVPRIGVSIEGPASAQRNEEVTLRVTVRNMDTVDLHSVRFEDCGDAENISPEVGKIGDLLSDAPYVTREVSLVIPDEATNPYRVCVRAIGEDDNRQRAFDTDQHVIYVEGAPPTLGVELVLDEPTSPDETTYTITVTNNSGTMSLTDVLLVDTYPTAGGNVRYSDSDPRGEHNKARHQVTWDLDSLEPYEKREMSLTLKVNPDSLPLAITNRVKVAATVDEWRITASAEATDRLEPEAKASK